jgi:sugar O-acyltransferase (sialic acid O-acetyltransferase NeuD family)
LLVGAGGHGQVVADILLARRSAGEDVAVAAFVDEDRRLHGTALLGTTVIGGLGQRHSVAYDGILVTVGDNARRAAITRELLSDEEPLATALHPASIISAHSVVGVGTMVCAGAVIGPGAEIGIGVILNTGSSVDHHCSIGDFAHVAPGARLGGAVVVGKRTLVGIGAVILPNVTVGDDVVVGAGAVVTGDVEDGKTVVGVPARPLMRG